MSSRNKIELLAPAGSIEKMKYAIHYGADAVYAGIPDVSMRARVNSFNEESLTEAAEYVHSHGRKIYVTLNIYAHNYHLPTIEKHLKFLQKISVDALIISDPGIISLAKKYLPDTPIHLSTQANATNWQAAKFWFEQGIERIVLAREVSLEDIREIKKHVPKLELEYFVHGAMCMSYSGRCILSKWMTGKSANLGDCSQPCRWGYRKKISNFQFPPQWDKPGAKISNEDANTKSNDKIDSKKYRTLELEEVKGRFGVELEEDLHGTYFFNSKDLKLIAHLEELKNAGVLSFKIEGRNKSVSYVASVTRAYRHVLDEVIAKKSAKEIKKAVKWAEKELDKLVNRGYTKGFLLGYEPEHAFFETHQDSNYEFVGEVISVSGKELTIKAHNAIRKTDELEIMTKEKNVSVKILSIINHEGNEVISAHGGHGNHYRIRINKINVEPMSLIRKVIK